MRKIILSLLIVFSLSSCYSMRLKSMLNHTKEELLVEWGIPYRTYKSGNNTELLLYKKSEKQYIPQSYRENSVFEWPENGWESKCETTFVLKNGIVTNYHYSGSGCNGFY